MDIRRTEKHSLNPQGQTGVGNYLYLILMKRILDSPFGIFFFFFFFFETRKIWRRAEKSELKDLYLFPNEHMDVCLQMVNAYLGAAGNTAQITACER